MRLPDGSSRRSRAGARRRATHALAAAAVAAAAVVATAGTMAAARTAGDTTAPASPQRAALLVFVSSQSSLELPLTPAETRAEAARCLAEALGAHGLELLTSSPAESLQQRWRVRSGLALEPAFLADLARRTATDKLLVAQVIGAPQRIELAARCLELTSDRLIWADVTEVTVAAATAATAATAAGDTAEGGRWRAGLREAAGRLAAGWGVSQPDSARAPLLVLPAEGVGVDAWQRDAATHCLLRDLLARGRAAILDPGVLVASLRADGRDPSALDAQGLRRAGERFRATQAVRLDLISYAPAPRHGDVLAPAPEEAPPDAAAAAVDLALALRRLDTRDATVLAAADVFEPAPPPTGSFGRPIRFSPLAQLDAACARLLADHRAAVEE